MLEKIINGAKKAVTGAVLLGSMALSGCGSMPGQTETVDQKPRIVRGMNKIAKRSNSEKRLPLQKQIEIFKKQGIHVRDDYFDSGSSNVVYLIPDAHATSIRQKKADIFTQLRHAGVSKIALEGVKQEVCGEEWAMKCYKNSVGTYEAGDVYDYLFGGERPRKIQTLEDYVESNPIYSLALNPNVTMMGLDKKETFRFIDQLACLSMGSGTYDFLRKTKDEIGSSLRMYKEMTRTGWVKKDEGEKAIKTYAESLKKLEKDMDEELGELKKEYVAAMEQARNLGYDWFKLPEPGSKEFTKKAQEVMDYVTLDVRSYEAAERLRNIDGDVAVVYGDAHVGQITEKLRDGGISYVVLGEQAPDKGFSLEVAKEIANDKELYESFPAVMGTLITRLQRLAAEKESRCNN